MSVKQTVSVIIPTYNRADLIPRAINSLLGQTHRPDQIIVVDDASTDNTSEVLASYAQDILAIKHPANHGLAAARNTGIQNVSCDVIALLDSDDTLLPTSIEKRLSILEARPDISVVYSDVWLVDEHGTRLARYTEVEPRPRPSGNVFDEFVLYNLMPVHGFMFRRMCLNKVGDFDVRLRRHQGVEDYDFWLRMASHFQFQYLDEPLAYYYIHSTMMTKMDEAGMQKGWLEVHRRIFDMAAFHALTPSQKSRAFSAHGTRCAEVGEIRDARSWYWRALAAKPYSARPYLLLLLTLFGQSGFNWVVRGFHRLRRGTAQKLFG